VILAAASAEAPRLRYQTSAVMGDFLAKELLRASTEAAGVSVGGVN
jgi:hypothetical protein